MLALLILAMIGAMLVAPAMALMAHWYRRQFADVVMEWKKPEMVLITVVLSAISLILFVIGLSGFFTDLGQIGTDHTGTRSFEHFRELGMLCFLANIFLFLLYLTLRKLLVQVITDRGIIENDKLLHIPDPRKLIRWADIADYYVRSDFPNVVVTLIVRESGSKFRRVSLKVPVYTRDEFERLLENKMYHAPGGGNNPHIRKQKFSEN